MRKELWIGNGSEVVVAELRESEISLKRHPYSKTTPLKRPRFCGTDSVLDYFSAMQFFIQRSPLPRPVTMLYKDALHSMKAFLDLLLND
jgi:hypothetical protein